MDVVETDYLVVGAGASGMGFVDSLVTHSDADVVLVDRRHRPGGHWNDAYPFVRLHLPSAYYGVASRSLGDDRLDATGPNAGWYERATGDEVCAYYARVLDEQLLPTGRVRFLARSDHAEAAGGAHLVTSRLTGETRQVRVRRAVVDARYLETDVPATHVPSFAFEPGAAVVPLGRLVDLPQPYGRFVVLGSGKTAMDACTWLLDQGVAPDRVQWVRPRDQWLYDRAFWQPLDQVASLVEGLSLEVAAFAAAESLDDALARLEACGRLVRIDPDVTPTMWRCTTVSQHELAQLRSIRDVVRLGRVREVKRDRLVLDGGEVPLGADALVVDCTAVGLRAAPERPVFEPGRITLQQVRYCNPSFNAALLGFVEASGRDLEEKNRLCPPVGFPTVPADLPRLVLSGLVTSRAWAAEPDIAAWMDGNRLDLQRGAAEHLDDPRMLAALGRLQTSIKPAVASLRRLAGVAG